MWVLDVGHDNSGKVYSVGYVQNDRRHSIVRCSLLSDAMELVHYLNGGGDRGTLESLFKKIGKDGSDKLIREVPES